MLGIWKDTEISTHPFLSSALWKLILGTQDVLQPTSPYKTNNSGKKGLPSCIGIVCAFSADRGSQIPLWQNQVQYYPFHAGIGISLFRSDLPNCHGCSSEWFPANYRAFREKKTPEIWAHFSKAIDFTVHFSSVKTCPNHCKIQFMANSLQPLPFYKKDDQVLLIHILLQSWLQETDLLPTSSWLLVISTLPLLIQPQHLHSNRHRVTSTGHFPSKAHRKEPEPTNLVVLITPSANHSKNNSPRTNGLGSLWSSLWAGQSVSHITRWHSTPSHRDRSTLCTVCLGRAMQKCHEAPLSRVMDLIPSQHSGHCRNTFQPLEQMPVLSWAFISSLWGQVWSIPQFEIPFDQPPWKLLDITWTL